MDCGLLLPHFGRRVDADRVRRGAVRAEELGFDSVWVRDHLFLGTAEPDAADLLDALTVLTAVGCATERLTLGTAALIPIRHPLIAASIISTMTQFVGPRVVIGVGSGSSDHESASVGFAGVNRPDLVLSTIEIMRKAWSGERISWHDGVFEFHDVRLRPRPGGDVPFWYCSNTPKSARIAAAQCQGWLPGRISLETLRQRVATIEELSAAEGRPRPTIGVVPAVSVAADRETALSRINVDSMFRMANNARFWVKPESGTFSTVDDLEGMLLYGSPDDIVAGAKTLHAAGVEHLVFDFRLDFDRWEAQFELIGREVLPELKAL